ncbi:Translation initiation factor eIF-2B subunit delta [Anthophora retusa]
MMEQVEHLAGKEQVKSLTRSTARHLRRKRLHDARRAEKQQEYLIDGVNSNFNQESVREKDSDQPEVITKSKDCRLPKKNEAKWHENCCKFCGSYHHYSAFLNQEGTPGQNTENIGTITKSKARRLRKKNKSKALQCTCSFCCDTYPSSINQNLVKWVRTEDCVPSCCAKVETGVANNLKENNYSPDNTVEAQICHIQYDKKLQETEHNPENIELQDNLSEFSWPFRPGLLQIANEIETFFYKLETQLKKNRKKFPSKHISTKKKPRLQRLDSKQFNELENSSDLQELANPANFVRFDRDIEQCSIEYDKEENFGIESISINSNESITLCLDSDLEKNAELKPFSERDIEHTFSSASDLVKNVKNVQFNDSSEINAFQICVTDNTELFPNNIESQDKHFISVIKENVTSANPIEEESETESIPNPCPAIQNCFISNTSRKEIEMTHVKISPVQNTNRLLSEINLLENTEVERPAIVPTKMMDNKVTVPEKSREEIKAEREAKKAAKALAKAKAKSAKTEDKNDTNNKSVGIKDKQTNEIDSIRNKESNETSKDVTKENIEPSNKVNVANKLTNACVKNAESEVASEGKSKAELRAERRAKQEAQRAAKQQLLIDKSKVKSKKEDNKSEPVTQTIVETHTVKKVTTPKKTVQKDNTHEINLFKHLYHEREQAIVHVPFVNSNIHLAIVRLGAQYASKVIVGSNARCVALLAAVKQLIRDFERPSQADFIRGLEATLQESIAYLHHCRPLAVSMQNALRHLKWQMTQLPSALSDTDAKNKLCSAIDTYILEQIELAGKAISLTIQTKISKGDVILTYGYSSLIHKILLDAHTAEKQFRVIVVDGRPWLEGKEQLRRLAKHGIECSYILINALSYMMPEVSKVFLGAHAILANGAVMSRVGTAQVALMARAFNIPVLVACETHKSCERVQTDSIVYNELGNADELVQDSRNGLKKSLLTNWRTRKSLNLLNITYDVTPADLVTAVVTELAILPCTSVPVILRIKPSEI